MAGPSIHPELAEQGQVKLPELQRVVPPQLLLRHWLPQRCHLVPRQCAQEPQPARHRHVDVQQLVRADRDDPAGARQPGEYRVPLGGGAAHRAQHLGVAGEQLHPGGVGAAGEPRREGLGAAGHAPQVQQPAKRPHGPPGPHPHHPDHTGAAQPPVPARNRLVRHPEHGRDLAERGAPVDRQAVQELPVQVVDFHHVTVTRVENHHS